MSRRARRAEGPPRAPVPQPDGWTLMEAAEALCPREARLYKQGGQELGAAMGADGDGRRDPGGSPELWLSKRLATAVANRPDLILTGRDVARHIRDGRSTLARDIVHAALRDDPTPSDGREIGQQGINSVETRLELGIRAATAHVERSLTKEYWTETSSITLVEVRVEASASARGETALPSASEGSPAGRANPVTPEFSEALLRAWFRMRVHGWPKDKPLPSGNECFAAAQEHFSGSFTRELFRSIRREMVPESWQKRGRRRPPN